MESLKPFSYLKTQKEMYQLTWISGIYHNIHDPYNPRLECLFSHFYRLPHAQDEELGYDSWINVTQISIEITVGYLACLCVGDIYKKGEKINLTTNSDEFRDQILQVDIDLMNPIKETTFGEVVSEEFFYNDFQHMKATPIKELPSYLASNTPATRKYKSKGVREIVNGSPIRLLIPEVEILRFYYVKSDALSRAIFNGHFSENNIGLHVINENYEKAQLINNRFRFVYRHGFNEADAIILGRILASSTALENVRRVQKTITKDNVNLEKHTFFRTGFPFDGKSRLTVQGRLGRVDNQDTFLVQKIISCSGDFPFSELSYCDEIQRGNPDPNAKPMNMKPSVPKVTGEENSNYNEGESTNTVGPDSAMKELKLEIANSVFTALDKISTKLEKFKHSEYKSNEKTTTPGSTGEDVSTGTPKNNGSRISKQKISDKLCPAPSGNLMILANAIRNSKFSKKFKSIKSLNLLDGYHEPILNEMLIPFPKVKCPKKKNKTRVFSFRDADCMIRRRVLCFELQYVYKNKTNYFYVLDAEERYVDDDLTILFLFRRDMEKIGDNTLIQILSATVDIQSWNLNISSSSLASKLIARTQNIMALNANILNKIKSISKSGD